MCLVYQVKTSCFFSTHHYDLTLENQVDCVSLYGNLQITKDQVGLQAARKLQAFMNEVVTALEQENLPEKIQRPPEQEIENPFL